MSFELKKGSRVYLIAIAGTGMSALAGLLRERGCEVSGTDVACYPPVSGLLESLGIEIDLGYHIEHLKKFNPDYVVIGNFVRAENELARYVINQGIPCGSLPSTLEDYFLRHTENFVVVGTHGKSTTSTLLAHLLYEAKRDPSFFIGAVVQSFQRSFRLGKGKDFVLEGDEYDTAFFDKESKFLHYRPTVGVWTSMEFDHADIFPSIERIEQMFEKFVRLIPKTGTLIYCRDWESVHQLVQKIGPAALPKNLLSYGFHPDSEYKIESYQDGPSGLSFQFAGLNIISKLSGRFNAQNIAAASLAVMQKGVALKEIEKAIRSFEGLKRRQEVRIEKNSSRVVDDFAHHPTAVKQVLEGLRKKYPDQKLVVFFEPRSNTTRRSFFQKEFESAFELADVVMLPEIFNKEAIPEADRFNVLRLVKNLQDKKVDAYGPLSTDQMIERAEKLISEAPCSFVVLSNGTFDNLHQKLISLVKSK